MAPLRFVRCHGNSGREGRGGYGLDYFPFKGTRVPVSFPVLGVLAKSSSDLQPFESRRIRPFEPRATKGFRLKSKDLTRSSQSGFLGSRSGLPRAMWLWSKIGTTGTPVNGNMDQNLRSPSALLLTHTHVDDFLRSPFALRPPCRSFGCHVPFFCRHNADLRERCELV